MLSAIKKIYKWIPKKVYIPLLCVYGFNFIAYYGARLINHGRVFYNIKLPIDDFIPFFPWMVVVYVGCYFIWILCFIFLAKTNEKAFYKCVCAEMLGKLICFAIFIIMPTTMNRPQIIEGGVFNWLLSIVYFLDEPNNLFPSIHVYISWLLWIEIYKNKNFKKYQILISCITAILVAFSVVLVKQHLFIDIVGGVFLAYFVYYLTERIYPLLEKHFNVKTINVIKKETK